MIKIKETRILEYPLREVMDKQNMSIRQLAKKSGVNYTYISRLLTGHHYASPEIVKKLRKALKEDSISLKANK